MEQLQKTIKCKNCGATLNLNAALNGVIQCEYCQSTFTVAKKDTSPAALEYLRIGEHDLDTGKFDDAYVAYEKAASLDGNEPEAYWGMALAEFKVRYLKDTVNDRLQPICYEFTNKNFTENKNYINAMRYATAEQKTEYGKRAADIDYIREEFLKIQQTDLNYDCFICVKVSRIDTERVDRTKKNWTEDAYNADAVYDLLKRSGYTPFFSEREIRGRTGMDYEAMILYALYTSETMLVVCSNEDYLQTPWVKNEYTRFKELINNKEKENNTLAIIYNGKPVEKLPGFKGKIQGIDYSRREADLEIVKFVESHTPQARERREQEKRKQQEESEALKKQIEEQERLRREFEEKQREEQERLKREFEEKLSKLNAGGAQGAGATATVNSLLKRAKQELNFGDNDKAKEYFDKVLDADPENAEAWWQLFLMEFCVTDGKQLIKELNPRLERQMTQSRNYKSALRYATGELQTKIKQFQSEISSPELWWSKFLEEMGVRDEKAIISNINAETCKKIAASENYANAVKYADGKFKERLKQFTDARYSANTCWKLFLEEFGADSEKQLLEKVTPSTLQQIQRSANYGIVSKSLTSGDEIAVTAANGVQLKISNKSITEGFKGLVQNFNDSLYSGELWWDKFLNEFNVGNEKEILNKLNENLRHAVENSENYITAKKFAKDGLADRIEQFHKSLHSAETWWDVFLRTSKVKSEQQILENFQYAKYQKNKERIAFIKAQEYCGDELKSRISDLEKSLDAQAKAYDEAKGYWQKLKRSYGCKSDRDLETVNSKITDNSNYKAAINSAKLSKSAELINQYEAIGKANNEHISQIRSYKMTSFIKRILIFLVCLLPSIAASIIVGVFLWEKMAFPFIISFFLCLGIGAIYQIVCLFLPSDNDGRQPVMGMLVQLLTFILFAGGVVTASLGLNIEAVGLSYVIAIWSLSMLPPVAMLMMFFEQIKVAKDSDYGYTNNVFVRYLPIFTMLIIHIFGTVAMVNGELALWHVIVQLVLTVIAVSVVIGNDFKEVITYGMDYSTGWITFGVFAGLSIIIFLVWLFWQIVLGLLGAAVVIGVIVAIAKSRG